MFGVLLALGLLVKVAAVLIPLLLLGACLYVAVSLCATFWEQHRLRVLESQREYAQLAARADWQNQLWLEGDPRGLYGDGSGCDDIRHG